MTYRNRADCFVTSTDIMSGNELDTLAMQKPPVFVVIGVIQGDNPIYRLRGVFILTF
jgi:hypothetical protein